jgi:hypothetical protein
MLGLLASPPPHSTPSRPPQTPPQTPPRTPQSTYTISHPGPDNTSDCLSAYRKPATPRSFEKQV